MDALTINKANYAIIDELLDLKYEPVALKMVEPGGYVPATAYKPKEDSNKHIALCQAFALARRDRKTVYLRKEDHWCWNPLIAYGYLKCEEKGDPGFETICRTTGIKDAEAAEAAVSAFEKLPLGKYEGILLAPLSNADYEPDLWLTYCDNGQLRTILRAIKTQTGKLLKSEFDPLDSCMYAVIPSLKTGEYRITFPDPGEYELALTDASTVMFSIPAPKFDEFLAGAKRLIDTHTTNKAFTMKMKEDYPRPPFYNELFSAWNLELGQDRDRK